MPHILIYDSGYGGLSITQEILKQPKNYRITYIADKAYFPYGSKPPKALLGRILEIAKKAITQFNPDVFIVACNTASTLALETLRSTHSTAFIGVVPAIKPAAIRSKTKSIGVLGTSGTVNQPYTKELISQFADNCKVELYASPLLVELAEEYIHSKTINEEIIRKEVDTLIKQNPSTDSIVLACTHFPLLIEALSKHYSDITWIDSGEAISRRTQQLTKHLQKAERTEIELHSTCKEELIHAGTRKNIEGLLGHPVNFEIFDSGI